MKTATRAPKGGTVGKNGEYYKGGTFLPSTQLPKRSPQQKKAGKGWEVPFYNSVRVFVKIDPATDTMGIGVPEQCIMNYKRTVAEVQEYCDRYNNGDRSTYVFGSK